MSIYTSSYSRIYGHLFSRRMLMLVTFLPALHFFVSACASSGAPNSKELALINDPPIAVKQKQDQLAPLALDWFKEIESKFVKKGRLLTEKEITMAKSIGVRHPEHVRVIILKNFPSPRNQKLLSETKNYGFGNSTESGRTMGYVVMLKARFKDERWILAHELAHVAQQERLGVKNYFRRFIAEHEILGRQRAPLEIDANKLALDYK